MAALLSVGSLTLSWTLKVTIRAEALGIELLRQHLADLDAGDADVRADIQAVDLVELGDQGIAAAARAWPLRV